MHDYIKFAKMLKFKKKKKVGRVKLHCYVHYEGKGVGSDLIKIRPQLHCASISKKNKQIKVSFSDDSDLVLRVVSSPTPHGVVR